MLNRRQVLQSLGAGSLLGAFGARVHAATAAPDVLVIGAGGAGLRRRGTDVERRFRARARGARPHRRPRIHGHEPRRALGPGLFMAAFVEHQSLGRLREAERLRRVRGSVRAPGLRWLAAHGRRRDRGLPRSRGADQTRTRQGRKPRARHSRGSGDDAGNAVGPLVRDGHGRRDRLGGRRACQLFGARLAPVRRERRGFRDPARLRDTACALREERGRAAPDARDAHPLGRARRRCRHRRRPCDRAASQLSRCPRRSSPKAL